MIQQKKHFKILFSSLTDKFSSINTSQKRKWYLKNDLSVNGSSQKVIKTILRLLLMNDTDIISNCSPISNVMFALPFSFN